MLSHTPKVSVVMPVYNGEAYIREAAESILHQTFQDFELIIINDGSTDGTAAILEKIAEDSRVRVLNNLQNAGLTYTRNKGINHTCGEYIAMLDSDDVAHPERLEDQVNFLNLNPEFGMVGACIDLVNNDGRYIRTQYYPAPADYIPSLLLFQNNFAQSAVMVRKSAIPSEGYRNEFPPAEDYDLWVRIATRYKVANLSKRLVKYRIHDTNISVQKANVQRESIKKITLEQLSRLGLTPTDRELDLHAKIGVLELGTEKNALLEAEKWLLKLRRANEASKCYPVAIFNCVVAQKWFEVCHNSGLGAWSYLKMVRSSLFNIKHASFILRTKLISRV